MKICNSCNEEKELTEFHKSKSRKDGLQPKCKKCNSTTVRKWQDENPEEFRKNWEKQYGNPRRRATKYGLTVDELNNLLESSDGVCTICGRKPNQWLVVDHCHKSSVVRGILCEKCNQALGLMEDNTEFLQNAIEYLNKFNGTIEEQASLAESG